MLGETYARPSRPSLAAYGIPDEHDQLAIDLRELRQAQLSLEDEGLTSSSSGTSVAASDTLRVMLPAPMLSFGVMSNMTHDLLYVGTRFDGEASGGGAYVRELDILG